jgi:hypothetical protein
VVHQWAYDIAEVIIHQRGELSVVETFVPKPSTLFLRDIEAM